MIPIGKYTFEVITTPHKTLKLRKIGKMGPYAHGDFSPSIFSAYRDVVQSTLNYVTKKIYNEKYQIRIETLRSLESLAKQYDFKDLIAWFERYWEDLDKVSLANNLFLEEKNRPNVEDENNKLIEQLKEEMETEDIYSELKKSRIKYLEEEKTNICSYLKILNTNIYKMTDRDTEEWLIDLYKYFNKWDFYDGKARSLTISIAHLEGDYDDKKVVVTDDMIELAKKVPFNKIIKLEVIGNRAKALCPFHKEKTPSFVVYANTNRGHCHGCGKNVDTIQYLVEVKKLKFNQAVLTLLSY